MTSHKMQNLMNKSKSVSLKAALVYLLGLGLMTGSVLADDAKSESKSKPKKYNVLFIAVDDLRPELGCYGHDYMHTPNIDRLAGQGTLFKRAYCQQALCNPSRASLLTGLRPDSTKVHDLVHHFRIAVPDVVTIAQQFKQHGYHTQGVGKILHGGLGDPASWTVPITHPPAPTYIDPKIVAERKRRRIELEKQGYTTKRGSGKKDPKTGAPLTITRKKYKRVDGPSWEGPDVADNVFTDGKAADFTIKLMQKCKKEDKPFFLACGFRKPHLPFVAPKKYFDLYPSEKVKLPDNFFYPKNVPELALHRWAEFRSYSDIPDKGTVPKEKLIESLRAYRACVSYIDAQVGRLLDELDRLDLRDNTVVVLWGDHGWHLGEQRLWGKMTNFETATHVPMIVSIPGQKNVGAKTDALVEFVDIYPTLCEACGFSKPDNLEGISVIPVMKQPDRQWKTAAFSQYPRPGHYPPEHKIQQMGYTMRTDRYRYTEWKDYKTGKVLVRELYDYQTDPQGNVNIADEPENAELVKKLGKQLSAGWQGSLPKK